MKTKTFFSGAILLIGLAFVLPLCADEPIIPPSISKVWPAGMERGTTATFTLEGRNPSDARDVIFDTPGFTGKLTQITEVPEKITGPRAGVDTAAQVPLGKKQTAVLEVAVAKDAAPGIHLFRIQSPLGTSNMVVLVIGTFPEVKMSENNSADPGARPDLVQLPATLIGTISSPGITHSFQFEGKAGEELAFRPSI